MVAQEVWGGGGGYGRISMETPLAFKSTLLKLFQCIHSDKFHNRTLTTKTHILPTIRGHNCFNYVTV